MLPIWKDIIPALIALLFLNWIIGKFYTKTFTANSTPFYFFLSVSVFVLYLLGLLYTQNMGNGLKNMETKLSLLIFPLIYFFSKPFSKEQKNTVTNVFVYGCITAMLICFTQATYHYMIPDPNEFNYGKDFFFKHRLSPWIHTSYIAMYVVMALFGLSQIRNDRLTGNKKSIAIMLLIVFVLMLVSKAGIIGLILFGIYSGWKMIVKEKQIKKPIIMTVTALCFSLLYYVSVPEFRLKINSVFESFKETPDVKNTSESTVTRMAIWNISGKIIKENALTGVGTGDATDVLFDSHKKEGLQIAMENKLNAHNQFIQTFLALGISGFLLLVISIALPLIYAIRKRDFLFVTFLILILINFSVEAMLETQAGVIFYAFFNSILFFSGKKELATT